MGGAGRRRAEVVEREVPARDGVQRVLRDAREAQLGGHLAAVGVEVDARQRTRPQRQPSALALGEGEPLPVAVEHPEVGQQMVPQVHGLGPLQVGVTGHRPVGVFLGTLEQRPHQPSDALHRGSCALARVQHQVGHHLVVARAGGVQTPADGADDLRQAPLDRHVDVLVVGSEGEVAPAQLALDRLESFQQPVEVLRRDDPPCRQHPRVGPRLGQVLGPQPAVEVDRGVQPLEVGVLGLGQARHARSVWRPSATTRPRSLAGARTPARSAPR